MITKEVLKKHIHYDPETGEFTRLISTINSPAGYLLEGKNAEGYIVFSVEGKRTKAHRWAFLYMTGEFPQELVDHKDGVRDNNKWYNLRDADYALNAQNRGKKCYSYSAGRKKPWRADITIYNVRNQQSFTLEQDAIEYIKQIKESKQ